MKGFSRIIVALSLIQSAAPPAAQPLNRPDSAHELAPATGEQAAPLLQLPPLNLPKNRISALPALELKEIRLAGNRVFDTPTLKAQIRGYEGRRITAEELQNIRNLLTQYYIDQGYINSGALIPDQDVQNGVVLINIIEGRLSEVQISGNVRLRAAYLQPRLGLDQDQPLNTTALQERLHMLQQNPLIKRFNAQLGPGFQPGEARLDLEILEERPYELGFNFNNHRAPSVGAYRGELWGRHRNLSGWGDTLYGRYGLTQGLEDYTLDYSLPVNRYDTALGLRAEHSDSEVIAEPFNQIDIKSESGTYTLSVRHPFYKVYTQDSHYRTLEGSLSLEKRRSETSLLDQPFSFSPGVEEGESKLTVLRLSQNWLDRSRNRVVAAYSSFNFGLDMLDATLHEDGQPDGKFFSWIGQFRWIERLPRLRNSQLWLRADLQWANDGLLPLEKFTIGGATSVRGYRENQLTRDKGFSASLEWQFPLARLSLSKIGIHDGMVAIAPFIDYGRGWNHQLETPEPRYLLSTGLGLLWTLNQYLHAEVYWGKDLRNLAKPQEYNLQDDGVHFALELKY